MNLDFDIKELLNNKLKPQFYLNDTKTVANELLGKILVRKYNDDLLAGKIVETEAYLSKNDFASHSAFGKTNRNSVMFEKGGKLYVYKIYGIHHCINVVTEKENIGSAVLIRAIQPIFGIKQMMNLRENIKIENLCKGPGNLAKAFGFTLKDNGLSLLTDELFISEYEQITEIDIMKTTRLGITKSKSLKLRFFIKDCNFVSGTKKQNSSF